MILFDILEKKTLLDNEYLKNLSDKANGLYSNFLIRKKNGGTRQIYHPSKELKSIQKVLTESFILELPIHPCATAYMKGSSIKNNAHAHKENKYFLRMDFRNFFESISVGDVVNFCEVTFVDYFPNWSEEDSKYFSKLVCYKNKIVMGAVTSPSLTNAMCFELDKIIFQVCNNNSVTYTRYADDLYFSCKELKTLKMIEKEVKIIISGLKVPSSLSLNFDKTYHSSKKRRVLITGIVITNDNKISIGRSKKRELRSKVFNWNKLESEEKAYLSGYLSYVKSIEPLFINVLCLKYGADVVSYILSFNSIK